MSCVKQTTKKYKNRKSPAYHAKDCKGKIMKGNDGNTWESKVDSRGTYRWVKLEGNVKKEKKQKKVVQYKLTRKDLIQVASGEVRPNKSVSSMSRNELLKNIRLYRNVWETVTDRNQDMDDERLETENNTSLKQFLNSYIDDTIRAMLAVWLSQKYPLNK